MSYGEFMASILRFWSVIPTDERLSIPQTVDSSRRLRRKIRRVKLTLARLYRATGEQAEIYRSLALPDAENSHRAFIFRRRANAAERRAERLTTSLRKYGIVPGTTGGTWRHSLRRWLLLHGQVDWTLALLESAQLRRSVVVIENMIQLSQLCHSADIRIRARAGRSGSRATPQRKR